MNFGSWDGNDEKVTKHDDKTINHEEDSRATEEIDLLTQLHDSSVDEDGWIPSLVQFQPVYELGYGNASKVELEDGTKFHYRHSSARTRRDIARYYAIDLSEMRHLYRVATSRSLSVPIVIASRDLVLVPVRTRTPQTKNDGCIGYIGHRFIRDVSRIVTGKKFDGLCITLTTGSEVFVDLTKQSFEQQLKDAKYFMYYLRERGLYF